MARIARPAFTALLLAAAALCTAAAADRHDVRAVSGFSAVTLAAPLDLRIVQGEREGLELDGDEAALALIETVVEEGALKIRLQRHPFTNWNYKVKGVLYARRMDAVGIAGAGDVACESLRGDAMKISVSGSGDVRIGALAAKSLEVKIAGSGDVTVAGKVDTLATTIAGSGDVRAPKLETRAATISITGSGDAKVWARESLDVKILGAGDVLYYGDATVQKKVLGAGSIKRLGAAPA